MSKFFKILLLSLTAALFVVSAYAQVTTSSLAGKVADKSGIPVVGAAVVAVHVPSGTQYYAVTNAEGRYSITGMRSGGPYSVEVSCLGYQKVTFTDVTLVLAEVYALNAEMTDDKVMLAEAIIVSKASSKFAAEKTGAVTNITNKEMMAMPTVSRSLTDITRLSPYGGSGMNFAGTDGRTANFTVDGANFNNNFGLSSSLPGGGNPISIDAIEELQVVISPYDVRQTNFIGGGVNAITKSGTNTFKGSAYVYHTNEYMRGASIEQELLSDARNKDRSTTYGLTFGGPIIKNKLFFFVNAEYVKVPSDKVSWRASTDGVGDSNKKLSYCTVQDLERVQAFAKEKYGYDTGSFSSFPADESTIRVLGKIDWNINDKNNLSLRYNYTGNTQWEAPNRSSMDGGTRSPYDRVGLYSMSFANSMYSINHIVHSATLDLNSRITDNLSNEFMATFSLLNDVRGSKSSDFPFIDIQDGTNTNTQYMSLGYELFSFNNAVHNTVATVKDDIIYRTGNHKITAGLNYEYQMADNSYMRNGTGYYRYASINDFINGATPEVVCLTYGYLNSNGTREAQPAARVKYHKAGIYAQDEWTPNEKFKLTYGIRFDGLFFDNKDLKTNEAIKALSYYPASYDYTEQHIDTGRWPNANLSVSPRIGFTWDILGDKSLKLRGGTGLFVGRLPLVFFINMPANSGMVQYKAALNAKSKLNGELVDMTQFAGGVLTSGDLYNKLVAMGCPTEAGTGTLPSSINAVDPNFKMPQVWKSSLAIDYAIPTSFPFSISAEGIFNKTINGVIMTDWSMKSPEGFVKFNGADNRPIFPSDFRNGTKAFVLENTNQGYGYSATFTLNMRPIPEIGIMAAYTRTGSKEITGMPGSDAESAFTYVSTAYGPNSISLHNSEYVTPDRLIASITHNDHCGNHFSLIYEGWRGGYNYSYMLVNDMNGDGYQYDALYIPTDEQVANNQFRFASADDRTRFMDYVHNDSYLSKHQGEYAEAYSVYSPWVNRLDFAYKHDFVLSKGKCSNILQLCFDLKNILNLFNDSWGVAKQMNSDLNSGRILKYETTDAEGYPVFSTPTAVSGSTQVWTKNHAIGQCWYASIGIKYMFN